MSRHDAAAGALFTALAIAMTWPLAKTLGSAVAWPGDPYINIWILDWDWWATFHHPLSLFNANTFYPAHDALAFSENLYGIALLLFPLRAAGVPPIASYNVAMLLGYAFSGFGAYLLGRYLTRSWWAGVAAGVFYAFVPFRITHAAHVQHVWGGWLPVMILALLYYAAVPSWKRAALFGGAFLINGLSNIHWLLFGSIVIAITALIAWPKKWLPLVACTAIAALLLTPFLVPYFTVSRDYHMLRTWQETKSFSAEPRDWLVTNPNTYWYGALVNEAIDPERWLFPGAMAIVLCVAGLFTRDRRALLIALAWIALGFAGSLGTHFFLHRFLFAYVPGFQAIRVPARWANVAYVGMAMLIALGVRRRTWVAALAAAAFAIELYPAPILWYLAVPDTPPVYEWIRDAKPHAVLELPAGVTGIEYLYMLRATVHHRPIVNGSSGFAPPEQQRIEAMTNGAELRSAGVSHVVVHGDGADDRMRQWLRREVTAGRLSFVQRFDGGMSGDWVFATSGAPRQDQRLDAFLAGQPTPNTGTFGFLDLPSPGERIRDAGYFSGFALSPYGVRSVTLRFQNGAVRIAPYLFDDPKLRQRFPWYAATEKPRFIRAFDKRPPGVREHTDVQVEIVDGRGRHVLLEDRFFVWPQSR